MSQYLEKLWRFGSLFRLTLFGWSVSLPLLGAFTVPNGFSARLIVAVLAAIPFHIILCILNDIVDRDLDRGDPRKAGRPLMSGAVRVRTATIIVGVAAPLPFILDPIVLGFALQRLIMLFIALGATAAYNLIGKRTPFPPLLDLSQGVGAGAFILYSTMVVGRPTWISWSVSTAVVLFIVILNGAHAGLRDLKSDYAFGACTTPIFFGALPGDGAPSISGRFIAYVWLLECIYVANIGCWAIYGLMRKDLLLSSVIAMVIFVIISISTLALALDSKKTMEHRFFWASAQMLSGVGCIASLATIRLGGAFALLALVIVSIPLYAKPTARAVHRLLAAQDAERREVLPKESQSTDRSG